MGRKRKKPMDKLSQDACDALAHGMSYGKWMAVKPPEVILPIKGMISKICAFCGKTFYQNDKVKRKFCSPECKDQARIQKIADYIKNRIKEKTASAEQECDLREEQ